MLSLKCKTGSLHLGPNFITFRTFTTLKTNLVLHLGPLLHLGPNPYYIWDFYYF